MRTAGCSGPRGVMSSFLLVSIDDPFVSISLDRACSCALDGSHWRFGP